MIFFIIKKGGISAELKYIREIIDYINDPYAMSEKNVLDS